MALEPTSFKGQFLLRSLHLDALIDGGFNLVLGADEEVLYMCDWPNQKRHPQALNRLASQFGLSVNELLALGSNGAPELTIYKCPNTSYIIREECGECRTIVLPPYSIGENTILDRTVDQLREYLCGERREFDLPLRPAGSDFQKRVWERLREIPYGDIVTYGRIAMDIGVKGGSKAVGTAVGSNPISIIIPCHRVLGANSLGGYAGGLDIKRAILAIEANGSSLFGLEY